VIVRGTALVSALLLFGVMPTSLGAAQQGLELAADYSSAVLIGNLRGPAKEPFRLEIDCMPPPGSKPLPGTEVLGYLGTDGEAPRCLVSTLKLAIGGKAIRFPQRSIADLGNVVIPRGVFLTSRDRTVVLHIKGGDGAAAYEVRFLIEQGRVTFREVETMDVEGELGVKCESLAGEKE